MRKLTGRVLLLFCATMVGKFDPAAAQDADHDNCYCPAGTRPDDNDNVSHITNAWTCVSTEKTGPRCATTVWCLSDEKSGPHCPNEVLAMAENLEAFVRMLPQMAAKHYEQIGAELPFDADELGALIEGFGADLKVCLAGFLAGGERGVTFAREGELIIEGEESVFQCVVLPSGGLQIIIPDGQIDLGEADRLVLHFNLP